jgi:hypothetical protein
MARPPPAPASVPAAPREGVAQSQEQPSAGVGHRARVIAACGGVEQEAEEKLAAAVVHLVDDSAIAPGGIRGTEEIEIRLVLHEAAGIAGRLVEVHDALVSRIPWIDLTPGDARHALTSLEVAAALASQRLWSCRSGSW